MMAIDEDFVEYNLKHTKGYSITRSISSLVSIASSVTLIWMICRSHFGPSTTYHRLLLGLCIADIMLSISVSLFTITTPRDVDYYIWNARGNAASCDAQGFLLMVGIFVGVLYNCSLSFYYLAIVKFQKPDDYIREKIEPYLHGVPIVYALGASITMLSKQLYNTDVSGVCSSAYPYEPPHCEGLEDGARPTIDGYTFEIPCGRGRGDYGLGLVLTSLPIIGSPIVVAITMTMMYRAVTKLEKKMRKNYGANSVLVGGDSEASCGLLGRCRKNKVPKGMKSRHRSRSRAVLYKAFAYAVAGFLTWVFNFVNVGIDAAGMKVPVGLEYWTHIFTPLQGLYNLLIFMYPEVISAKRSKKDNLTWPQAIMKAFWSKGQPRRGNKSITTKGRVEKLRKKHGNHEQKERGATSPEEEKCEVRGPLDRAANTISTCVDHHDMVESNRPIHSQSKPSVVGLEDVVDAETKWKNGEENSYEEEDYDSDDSN